MPLKNSYGFIVLTLLLSATSARAQSNLCTPGTLTAYQNMSFCDIGIEQFEPFSALSTGGSATSFYTPDQIEVTPQFLPDGESAGFSFSLVNMTPFEVGSGMTSMYSFSYQWFFNVDPAASAASLGSDPPFGNFSISQYYCVDSSLSGTGLTAPPTCNGGSSSTPQSLTVSDANPPTSLFQEITLNPEVTNFASVLSVINLDGTNGAAGFDSVTGDDYVAGSPLLTPEPSTIILAVGGMLALALLKRL